MGADHAGVGIFADLVGAPIVRLFIVLEGEEEAVAGGGNLSGDGLGGEAGRMEEGGEDIAMIDGEAVDLCGRDFLGPTEKEGDADGFV